MMEGVGGGDASFFTLYFPLYLAYLKWFTCYPLPLLPFYPLGFLNRLPLAHDDKL
jgi:hypothetical protein